MAANELGSKPEQLKKIELGSVPSPDGVMSEVVVPRGVTFEGDIFSAELPSLPAPDEPVQFNSPKYPSVMKVEKINEPEPGFLTKLVHGPKQVELSVSWMRSTDERLGLMTGEYVGVSSIKNVENKKRLLGTHGAVQPDSGSQGGVGAAQPEAQVSTWFEAIKEELAERGVNVGMSSTLVNEMMHDIPPADRVTVKHVLERLIG
ncbi:hypothetical protein MUP65_01615 [Patescibacteria group bacterium]|nr:hypothetical protein [Patescibacteria group bacterium]